jgi:HlyD family secretion protein
MTANVSIVGAQRDNALKVSNAALRFRPPDVTPPPAGALGRRGKPGEHSTERTVYALRGSKPSPVQIKTGISDGISTEVLDGLREGDRVVTAMTGRRRLRRNNRTIRWPVDSAGFRRIDMAAECRCR